MMKRIFVSGIGTEVGKTITCAILCRALGADYWKPVQSGNLNDSDSKRITSLCGPECQVHKECYTLRDPLSPNISASREGVRVDLASIINAVPHTSRLLVIEGSGGLLTPLSDDNSFVDLLKEMAIPLVLVSRHYLGSINHTLLSLELIKARKLPFLGLIFVGNDVESENSVLKLHPVPVLFRIDEAQHITPDFIASQAQKFSQLPALEQA